MKNSILAILALTAIVSCKKTETTVIDDNADSTAIVAPVDSTMTSTDYTNTSVAVKDMSSQDKMFADKAATGGMMEVILGEFVSLNGENSQVKSLGKMMYDDHTKVNNELKAWATAIGYTLPSALMPEQQKMVDDMMTLKGADLDRAYTDMMVKDHKEDIALFKKEAAEGTTADLKMMADKTVPTLEQHLAKSEAAMMAVK